MSRSLSCCPRERRRALWRELKRRQRARENAGRAVYIIEVSEFAAAELLDELHLLPILKTGDRRLVAAALGDLIDRQARAVMQDAAAGEIRRILRLDDRGGAYVEPAAGALRRRRS
jgi:hypothetical protein